MDEYSDQDFYKWLMILGAQFEALLSGLLCQNPSEYQDPAKYLKLGIQI